MIVQVENGEFVKLEIINRKDWLYTTEVVRNEQVLCLNSEGGAYCTQEKILILS